MRIEICENLQQRMQKDNKFVREVLAGKKGRPEKTILVTPEVFASIFSAERMRLLLRIRNESKNIYQLAKELDRKYEAVYRDVKLLEGYGILHLERENRKTIPILDSIEIPTFSA